MENSIKERIKIIIGTLRSKMLKTSIRQKIITGYNLISKKITDILDKWASTLINFLLKKMARQIKIDPLLLFTENRKDIDYRISFLRDVLIKKINPKKTAYYAFVLELDSSYNPDLVCKRFLEVCNDIKKNGIKEPIYIIKCANKTVRTRYVYNRKKYWRKYENKTKYQIFDGAHRVAIAIFEGYKKVPCKIFKPVSFEIPDYTGYAEEREGLYNALTSNLGLLKLHRELNKDLSRYFKHFGRGGFYQGLESIHVIGQRPTENRFKIYGLEKYLKKNQYVLDIGSNCGFFSLYTSQFVGSVDGIELNQSFIDIANKAKKYLRINNCNFYKGNLKKLKPKNGYDVILSLAVHVWINMSFREYLNMVEQMLNENGILVLESQDIKEDIDFEKNVKHILGRRFVVEREGTLKDDGIVKRQFMILRKL